MLKISPPFTSDGKAVSGEGHQQGRSDIQKAMHSNAQDCQETGWQYHRALPPPHPPHQAWIAGKTASGPLSTLPKGICYGIPAPCGTGNAGKGSQAGALQTPSPLLSRPTFQTAWRFYYSSPAVKDANMEAILYLECYLSFLFSSVIVLCMFKADFRRISKSPKHEPLKSS